MARSGIALLASALITQVISVQSGNLSGTGVVNLTRPGESPLLECLRSGLSKDAVVETAGQPGFLTDSTRYTTLASPSYKAVAKVASEHDIAISVSDPMYLAESISSPR